MIIFVILLTVSFPEEKSVKPAILTPTLGIVPAHSGCSGGCEMHGRGKKNHPPNSRYNRSFQSTGICSSLSSDLS